MTEKRKVRTLVRDGDDMKTFEYFEDAMAFLEVDLGDALCSLLEETATDASTIVMLLKDGSQLTEQIAGEFAAYPLEHRGAFVVSGIALIYTMPSRDPVLVVDAGEAYFMVVTERDRLSSFLAARYHAAEPLNEPENVAERWVLSISLRNELFGTKVGVGTRPGTAQA